MSNAGVDAFLLMDSSSHTRVKTDEVSRQSKGAWHHRGPTVDGPPVQPGPRRTPRKSLIVVLPENHVVSPEVVSECLSNDGDNEVADVILACAGTPLSIGPLQRRIRELQVLLAPAGTSPEDLRELAMRQAPGDIVTLLGGVPVSV
jgi:hypothetical protein